MKPGDMVRFAKWEEVDIVNTKSWSSTPKNHIGVLVNHDQLMQTVEVLSNGEVYKLRSVFVEKAGKKDFDL